MYSKVKIGGHPIHPMLVAFPIAFYTTTLLAFVIYQYFNPDIFWYKLAYFCNFAGVFTALFAAVPGFMDWAVGIPKSSAAKKRGFLHMLLNVGALTLFAINAFLIYGTWDRPLTDVTTAWVLSLMGVGLTMVAGFHGWALIAVHKVGVTLTPQQEILEPTGKMDRHQHEVDIHSRSA